MATGHEACFACLGRLDEQMDKAELYEIKVRFKCVHGHLQTAWVYVCGEKCLGDWLLQARAKFGSRVLAEIPR